MWLEKHDLSSKKNKNAESWRRESDILWLKHAYILFLHAYRTNLNPARDESSSESDSSQFPVNFVAPVTRR